MSDELKFKIWVETNKIGSHSETSVTIDKEEWDEMGMQERNEYMHEILMQSGLITWDWEELLDT